MANLHSHVIDNRSALTRQIKERKQYQELKKQAEQHKQFISNRSVSIQTERYQKIWMQYLHIQALEENIKKDRRISLLSAGLIVRK